MELRQQKWVVKRRELELIASKNFLLPQLDAVGKYTWTGFGNKLIESVRRHGRHIQRRFDQRLPIA